jgi:hypothetical protein
MTNVYLLKGKKGYLLIDAGQNIAKVDKQIKKIIFPGMI